MGRLWALRGSVGYEATVDLEGVSWLWEDCGP